MKWEYVITIVHLEYKLNTAITSLQYILCIYNHKFLFCTSESQVCHRKFLCQSLFKKTINTKLLSRKSTDLFCIHFKSNVLRINSMCFFCEKRI